MERYVIIEDDDLIFAYLNCYTEKLYLGRVYPDENILRLKTGIGYFPFTIENLKNVSKKKFRYEELEKNKILYPKDDVLIQTNHYVDPELANEDTVLREVPYHNTFIRYYETLQKINFKKDKFNFSDIIKVLGAPNSYTCQNFPGVKTIWTLALDMKNQKYKLFWDLFGKRKEKVLNI